MKKVLSIFICVILLLEICMPSFAVEQITADTVNCVLKTVVNPQVGSIGGEWAVIGIARSGEDISENYFENYYKNVEKYVTECGGVLHERKYTEYSRVILALTAIGKNPGNVAGYNLLMPLGDFKNTVKQGINGAIWALIALDSGNYEMPQNVDVTVRATREMYVSYILEKQTPDGGWALYGEFADPDITGMALQALSRYQNDEKVKAAIEKALFCMSSIQNENGGFSSQGAENVESSAQMLIALCALEISVDDVRFVKNGKTIYDNLKNFYIENNGFKHTLNDTSSNLMATEQALCALAAVKRFNEGKNKLYDMSEINSDLITVEIPENIIYTEKFTSEISLKWLFMSK